MVVPPDAFIAPDAEHVCDGVQSCSGVNWLVGSIRFRVVEWVERGGEGASSQERSIFFLASLYVDCGMHEADGGLC